MSDFQKEFEVEFVIDGIPSGSGTVFVRNGEVQTENIEEEFYSMLRKNDKWFKEEAEDAEREEMIDNLKPDQEEKLKEAHMKQYRGTDDDAPDDYEDWLIGLSLDELKEILK